MMREILSLLLGVVLVMGLVAGCASKPTVSESGPTVAADVELCAKCGHVKGAELCCKPGQEICAKCGLVKGSPGCCKPGQEICAKCGLVKGSLGCCKLNK